MYNHKPLTVGRDTTKNDTTIMRKIVLSTLFAVLSICASAQTPIKFLGIPVDGSKAEMIEKIKAKGYKYDTYNNCLVGEFNGRQSQIYIVTNNNKVYRVAVIEEKTSDEAQIRIRFNNLTLQFMNNEKYELSYDISNTLFILDNEDIAHEISINKKQYQVAFEPKDKSVIGTVWYMIAKNYGSYNICIYYDNTMNKANGEDL